MNKRKGGEIQIWKKWKIGEYTKFNIPTLYHLHTKLLHNTLTDDNRQTIDNSSLHWYLMRRIYQTSQHCHTDAVELRTAAHGRLQVDCVVILTTNLCSRTDIRTSSGPNSKQSTDLLTSGSMHAEGVPSLSCTTDFGVLYFFYLNISGKGRKPLTCR